VVGVIFKAGIVEDLVGRDGGGGYEIAFNWREFGGL